MTTEFGEFRSETVLLTRGEYRVQFTSLPLPEVTSAELVYRLTRAALDEPLGPVPVDPTEDPFCSAGCGEWWWDESLEPYSYGYGGFFWVWLF